jgi:RNA polymerase sigma factor for flagellar operon FliA
MFSRACKECQYRASWFSWRRKAVVVAIDQLPEREKMVMNLYYVDELNLKEIGEVLGVSESRVSQILSTVVKKLRLTLHVGN